MPGITLNFDPFCDRFQPEKMFEGLCLFYLGRLSLSTIFQSYCDGISMWQGSQCSLLECCLTEISRPRHLK